MGRKTTPSRRHGFEEEAKRIARQYVKRGFPKDEALAIGRKIVARKICRRPR